MTVVGVMSRYVVRARGRSLIRAASTARSAQSSRGVGFCRRRTAFSWRRTKISTSLAALVRARRASQPTMLADASMINANLVLIHGFWSSPATWDKLAQRLEKDADLSGL